ncbi:MAG: DNA-protecting protein DprA, partial [Rhodospirillales bacterium]|nr:DNA-protecting protein DprA [Rhodospirillales bacterium]
MTPDNSLTDRERRDWLRLIRSENIGPITFFQLLRRFGSATAALAALPDLARSANGVRFARRLAGDLGAAGLVVVSGLARGIDTAAHHGSLASGTVAAMAGGVDTIYPPENEALYRDILAAGAAISEMPPGLAPQARHFPRRNRLIAGIGLGTVVVEAAERSGSLITARLALEQGREVFAVPGSPLDPRARGCNGLIRQGAVLVEGAEDVLRELGGLMPPAGRPDEAEIAAPAPLAEGPNEPADAHPRVVEKLGPTPVPVDEIVRQC